MSFKTMSARDYITLMRAMEICDKELGTEYLNPEKKLPYPDKRDI